MRFLIPAVALTLTACSSPEEPAPATTATLAPGTFAGGGRDALCIAGEAGAQRAGFIVYSDRKVNCSASGRLERTGEAWTLTPAGDSECRIPVRVEGDALTLGAMGPACNYYCGPDMSFADKQFRRAPQPAPATDLAGDPLC